MPRHNRSTCNKRSGTGTSQVGGTSEPAGNTHSALNSEGGGSSQPIGSQSVAGGNTNAIVVLSNTQKSSTSGTKRNSTADVVHRAEKRYVYLHLVVLTYAACI